jgi:hypothetical protein
MWLPAESPDLCIFQSKSFTGGGIIYLYKMEHEKETLQTALLPPPGIFYQNLFTRYSALQVAYTLPLSGTGTIFLQGVNVDSTLLAGMHTTGCRERIQA